MVSTRKNYYGILGVSENAQIDEIKKGFKNKMMEWHPDKCRESTEFAKSQAQEIVEAYRVLSKSRSKEIYDLSHEPSMTEVKPEDSEFKAIGDLYTTFKPRSKRDPNAKAAPGFKWGEFLKLYHTLSFHNQTAELEDYLEKNITNLEATNIDVYQMMDLCQYHNEETYQLITRFDSEWLVDPIRFGRMDGLGQFLNTLPTSHWEMVLNHLTRKWVEYNLNTSQIRSLTGKLCGADISSQIRNEQLYTLMNYLGQERLRQIYGPVSLALLISDAYLFPTNGEAFILAFIEGQDQGLRQIITTGAELGDTLTALAPELKPKSFLYTQTESELYTDTKDKWEFFLKYLPHWQEKFLHNPRKFNELLKALCPDRNGKSSKRICLFLETYFKKESICNFEDLLAVLKPPLEEKLVTSKSSSLNLDASLQLIHFLDDKQLSDMLLDKNKDQDILLANLDIYKNEPFYKALLLAATRVCRYMREENPNAYIGWVGVGYSREQIKAAADSLTQSILANEPIHPEFPGIMNGKLGKISQRYMESLKPVKQKSYFRQLLLN